LKILHIAPFNYAGVPMNFVKAERNLGHYSRLIVLGGNTQKREGDIFLNLPFIDSPFVRAAKKIFTPKKRRKIVHDITSPEKIPNVWSYANYGEKFLIKYREALWRFKIDFILKKIDFLNFDLYQLDGGLGFYRDSRLIKKLHSMGKMIVVCYTGSDLRTRGVIPEIESISDLIVTVEFDHLKFHNNIRYVPFPFDFSVLPDKKERDDKKIIIGHAPTNREAKGSDVIIHALEKLKTRYKNIEINLIEGMPYKKALERKSMCHIFIDQIGNLGYGINSIESLAMGIVTCSGLAPGFKEAFPDHPFVEIDAENVEEKIEYLVKNKSKLEKMAEYGEKWVRSFHDSVQVVNRIHKFLEETEKN